MTTIFIILIVAASAVLGLIVLVQNPKGGGLAGNIAGFSNQFMGVKQTTDVLEKGTWLFAGIIALLCFFSVIFIPGSGTSKGPDVSEETRGATVPATTNPTVPTNTVPINPGANPTAPK